MCLLKNSIKRPPHPLQHRHRSQIARSGGWQHSNIGNVHNRMPLFGGKAMGPLPEAMLQPKLTLNVRMNLADSHSNTEIRAALTTRGCISVLHVVLQTLSTSDICCCAKLRKKQQIWKESEDRRSRKHRGKVFGYGKNVLKTFADRSCNIRQISHQDSEWWGGEEHPGRNISTQNCAHQVQPGYYHWTGRDFKFTKFKRNKISLFSTINLCNILWINEYLECRK